MARTEDRTDGITIRIGVDIGGTFTDIVGLCSDGTVAVEKLLSSVDDYSRSISQGIDALLKRLGLKPGAVSEIVHATTVATNAILEARGARTALITTLGFRDVLDMRRQRRPDMYSLDWTKPTPIVERYLRYEVDERVDGAGKVVRPLDMAGVDAVIDRLKAENVESIAVCLLNAFVNMAHEQQIAKRLRERLPGIPVSLSCVVSPEAKEYERTSTTCINAYVQPVMQRYLGSLRERLQAMGISAPLLTMQSNGGILNAAMAAAKPVSLVESGPAAGVIGGVELARRLGGIKAVTFDMGGTTAKAALIEDGEASQIGNLEVGGGLSSFSRLTAGGGYTISTPSIDVAEIGIGGGSIAWLDESGTIHVGPHSAGASPGPACYGLGGDRPTVTDANLVLGFINDEYLVGGDLKVDRAAAEQAIARTIAGPLGIGVEEAAHGIIAVANSTMTRVIRAISSERGRDPRDAALICFGGNGAVHAAELARMLDMTRIVVPQTPGVFSAYGLLHTDIEHSYSHSCFGRLDETRRPVIEAAVAELVRTAEADFAASGYGRTDIEWVIDADLQYKGQGSTLKIRLGEGEAAVRSLASIEAGFHDEHQKTFGYCARSEPVEIVTVRVAGRIRRKDDSGASRLQRAAEPDRKRLRNAYFSPELGFLSTPILRREDIGVSAIRGPAIIEQYDTTIVVPPGASVALDASGSIVIELAQAARTAAATDARFDAATRELVRHALEALADEMALTLIRTCRSHHVKHTGDFSTALADAEGRILAQGMTIPLHLGAMPDAVAELLRRFGNDICEGDVFMMNDPFGGGMHLPDIFIMKPIFHDGRMVAIASSVVHHLDIGGNTAGGNSPLNTETFAEGIRMPMLKLYDKGRLNEGAYGILLANVRVPDKVEGDLQAQLSACRRGEEDYLRLVGRYGLADLQRYQGQLLDASETLARQTIAAMPDGEYEFEDFLDGDGIGPDPIRIKVRVQIAGDEATVDCTGSAPQVAGALNSTLSATKSTAYLAFRCLMPAHTATNAGYMRPISVIAPAGTVLNGVSPAAGAARAITAYRLMDALFGALGKIVPGRVMAAGDGGSLLHAFSGRTGEGRPFIFVDMLRGSWGARQGGDGLDGTSLALANASSVPAEIIDVDGLLRLEYWGYVPDSCGAGEFRGGMAVMREYRFLAPAGKLQYRSERRKFKPYGLAGGENGTPSFVMLDPFGEQKLLPDKGEISLVEGTLIRVCQSGGGGYGDPFRRDPEHVRRDVRDGLVGIAAAREKYGVAIDAASGEVDAAATATLRSAVRGGGKPAGEAARVEPVTPADLDALVRKSAQLREGWVRAPQE